MSRAAEDVRTAFLPAIYHVADRAATTTRRRYMRLVAANLGLVLAATVVASLSAPSDDVRRVQALITAGVFGLSLTLSLAMATSKYDRVWVKSRALAESIKSTAWRFAMSAAPFDAMPTKEAEQKLLAQLEKLVREAPTVAGLSAADDRAEITNAMVALRHAPVDVRRDRYATDRIADQRDWFAARAVSAARAGRAWGALLIGAQTAGFVAALVMVWSPGARFNARAVFAAFAAASLGWLRATQHREVAATYTAMSQTLKLSGESARRADTEDALTAIVVETETALEQENGAWMQRRSVA